MGETMRNAAAMRFLRRAWQSASDHRSSTFDRIINHQSSFINQHSSFQCPRFFQPDSSSAFRRRADTAIRLWTAEGAGLDESYRLPRLAELEERAAWAELRAAWSEAGLAFAVHVRGKQQPPWCRESRLDDSDCLQIWIDTRDVHNVHRAGRFCHRFIFLPCGAGRGSISRWPARCRSTARGSSPTRFGRNSCRPLANGRATTIYWRRSFPPKP